MTREIPYFKEEPIFKGDKFWVSICSGSTSAKMTYMSEHNRPGVYVMYPSYSSPTIVRHGDIIARVDPTLFEKCIKCIKGFFQPKPKQNNEPNSN